MAEKTTAETSQFKTGIIGCGWLGLHIARYLHANNEICTTTTSEQKNEQLIAMGFNSIAIRFDDDQIIENKCWDGLNSLDTIIITVPFSKRDDISTLKNRFENICSFMSGFDKQLFLMSSIGIYPDIQMDISENSLTEDSLNPSLLFVEQLIKSKSPQVNILRLGGLMGGSRVFSNYPVTASQQVVNHVHYEDVCLIIKKMISERIISKTYNVIAPLHPTKQEIIDHQKGNKQTSDIKKYGRIIISDLLQKELGYQYIHEDPKLF
jgi:nucleoside-diphosphate-sugar epimerase